jgi:hypothetical protein
VLRVARRLDADLQRRRQILALDRGGLRPAAAGDAEEDLEQVGAAAQAQPGPAAALVREAPSRVSTSRTTRRPPSRPVASDSQASPGRPPAGAPRTSTPASAVPAVTRTRARTSKSPRMVRCRKNARWRPDQAVGGTVTCSDPPRTPKAVRPPSPSR